MPIVPNYDFLTVEDINTVILNEGLVFDEFYQLDTRIIYSDNSKTYNSVRCDFIVLSKTKIGNEYEYILEIRNSLWDGTYSFLELPQDIEEPEVIQVLSDPNTLKIRGTDLTYFIIQLHLTNNSNARVYESEMCDGEIVISDERIINKGDLKVSGVNNITIPYIESLKLSYTITDMNDVPVPNATVVLKSDSMELQGTTNAAGLVNFSIPSKLPGIETVVITASCNNYGEYNKSFQIKRTKINLNWSLTNKIQIKGAYNNNTINFTNNKLLDKSIITGKTIKITANNKTIKTTIGSNLKATFELNLRGNYKNNLSVKVEIPETKYTNSINKTIKLTCDYYYATNYANLKSQCENSKGADIIRLKNGTTYTSTGAINISRDITIQGQKGTKNWTYINGNNNSIFVVGKATLTLRGIELYKGNPAIYQKEKSSVIIDNCLFKNNMNNNHNQSGSVIFCKVGTNSKKKDDLFHTNIKNSYFYNNHGSCINHGGQLNVSNSDFLKDSFTYFNQPEPFVVSQRYGDAVFKNNRFDIDTGESIKSSNCSYAKAICVVGRTATVNGKLGSKLLSNDSLPLCNSNYGNKAHLYVKYYYPYLKTNLVASPKSGHESSSYCHAVEGKSWAYSDWEYLSRVSWSSENKNRKFTISIPLNGGYY